MDVYYYLHALAYTLGVLAFSTVAICFVVAFALMALCTAGCGND
jgi:hypothetical protein